LPQKPDADHLIPDWANDAESTYRFEVLPPWFSTGSTSTWNRWQMGNYVPGVWVQISPLPPEIAQAVDAWWNEEQRRSGFWLDARQRSELLVQLEKEFGPKGYRFGLRPIRYYPEFGLVFRQNPPSQSPGDYTLIVHRWVEALDAAAVDSLIGHKESATIKPIAPRSHFRYWAVEFEVSGCSKLAFLETRGSVQLASQGEINLWAYGQKQELYQRLPGLRIDPNWHKLPTVLAMATWEGCFFRAYRGTEPKEHLLDLSCLPGEWQSCQSNPAIQPTEDPPEG